MKKKRMILAVLLCGLLCNTLSVAAFSEKEENSSNVFKKGGAILAITSRISTTGYFQNADFLRNVNSMNETGAGFAPEALLIASTGQTPEEFFRQGTAWIDPNIGRGYISVPITIPSPGGGGGSGSGSNGSGGLGTGIKPGIGGNGGSGKGNDKNSNGDDDATDNGGGNHPAFGPPYIPFLEEPDDSDDILGNLGNTENNPKLPDLQSVALLYRSIFADSKTRIKMSYYDENGVKTSVWFYLGLLGTNKNLASIATDGQILNLKDGTFGGNDIYGNLFETNGDGILEDAYNMIFKILGSTKNNNTSLYGSDLIDIDDPEDLSKYLSKNSSVYIKELQRAVDDYEGYRNEWVLYAILNEKETARELLKINNENTYVKYHAPVQPDVIGSDKDTTDKLYEEYLAELEAWKRSFPEAAKALDMELKENQADYEKTVDSYDTEEHRASLEESFDKINTEGESLGAYPEYLRNKKAVELIDNEDDAVSWYNWVTRGTTEADPNDKSTWICPDDAGAFREWLIKRDLYEGDYSGYSMDMDIYNDETEGGTPLSLWQSVYNDGKNRVTSESYPYLYSYTDATNASFREGGSNFDQMLLLQHKLGLDTGRNGKRLDLKYYKDICVQDYKNTEHSESVPIQRYEWYVYYSPGKAINKEGAEVVFHSATTQKECPFIPNQSGTYWVDCFQTYRVKYYETLEYTESAFLVDETTKSVLMAYQNQNGVPISKTINEKEVVEKVSVLSGVQGHYMESGHSGFKIDNGIVSASYSTERISD